MWSGADRIAARSQWGTVLNCNIAQGSRAIGSLHPIRVPGGSYLSIRTEVFSDLYTINRDQFVADLEINR